MARPLRLEYPGAVYLVMARGQERGAIFREEGDRERFLEELSRVVVEQRWVVHGYCLMTNHYHLLVETPEANLSTGMQLLNGRYNQAFNVQWSRKGHLFEDRYKAIVVEKESYLLELCRYVVLNPVRARMVRSPREWRWSNQRATSGEGETPGFLDVGWTLEQFGTDAGRAREGYRRFVAEGQGAGSPMDGVTGQVFLGGPEFVLEMRRRLDAPVRRAGRPRRRAGAVAAALLRVLHALRLDELVRAGGRAQLRAHPPEQPAAAPPRPRPEVGERRAA